ncbi:MAG: hypothetical protein QM687_03390 [Ferruginibacter sp.]
MVHPDDKNEQPVNPGITPAEKDADDLVHEQPEAEPDLNNELDADELSHASLPVITESDEKDIDDLVHRNGSEEDLHDRR